MSKLIAIPSQSNKLKIETVGGKAFSLIQLLKLGIPVPDFYVLTSHAYRLYKKSPEHFFQQIDEFFKAKEFPYSVRSSAPFEDTLSFSLAGQLRSELDLKNSEQLKNGIKSVFSSIDEPHLQSYLDQFFHSQHDIVMAALVQKMVYPQIAGVIFTKHPLQPESDDIYVEIIMGSCNDLVSGKCNPSNYTFQRNGHIRHRSDEQFAAYEFQLKNLVRTALKIESFYRTPQDIEWGIADNKLWILQSRPITNFSNTHLVIDKQGTRWTDYFYAERFVDPITPLGWAFIKKPIEKNAFADTLWFLGKSLPKNQELSKLINGRPFTNLSAFHQIYSIVPSAFISPDKLSALRIQHNRFLVPLLKSLPYLVTRMLFKDMQWLPEVTLRKWRWIEKDFALQISMLKKQLQDNPLKSSLQVFHETEKLSLKFLSNHRWAITFADIFTDVLKKMINFLKLDISTKSLLGGLQNRTISANIAMDKLNLNDEKQIECFLENYGHKAKSLDIFEETWQEHFDELKKIVQKKQRTIVQDFKNKENERQCEYDKVKFYLNGLTFAKRFFLRTLFHIIYHYSKEFTILRENQRDLWQQILALTRRSVLIIADDMQKKGILPDRNLIFFCNKNEFFKLNEHPAYAVRIVPKAEMRQKQYMNLIEHSFDIPIDKSKKVYYGLSVSNDQAIGKARIARNYKEAFQCEPGEILIVRSADPAWSPVFQLAAGLVMETGGVLSHASIVAREFGLATVTGIAGATQAFNTGELIQVDGKSGSVMKISQGDIDDLDK